MTPNPIRFPRLYEAVIRNLQVDLLPSHFFDLLVLMFVFAAFGASALTMGGVEHAGAVMAPRLLAAAAALHAYSIVSRADTGVRIRWMGLLFLPFALWLLLDSRFHSPAVWRGREQGVVALTAAVTFWVTLHHMRHTAHKWFVFGLMGLFASMFGGLVISGGHNLLPRLAQRTAADAYLGHATGPFGTPAEFGAFLLICIFPAGAVLASPSLRYRRRIAAGYAVILGYVGVWSTHHAAVWYGLLAGCALMGFLLLQSRRVACVVATGLFGFSFLIPKIATLNSGLFRSVEARSLSEAARMPLPVAASEIFQAHPIAGAGSGGFQTAFETVRPWGWSFDPETAGGFFHHLAAENGVVGLALLVLPALVLWVLGLRLCLKEPVRLTRLDRQFDKKKTYVPERRVAFAGMLSGTLAATVVLALDYPRPSVPLAIAFAVCGAVAVREIFGKRLATTREPVEAPNYWIRGAVAAMPVLAFALYVFPVFESAEQARRAEDFVNLAEDSTMKLSDGRAVLVSRGSRLTALTEAQRAATDALRTVPDNVRAVAALAETHAARHRILGKNEGLGDCRSLAELAASLSPEPRFNLPLLTAYAIYGENDRYDAHLAKLREAAPRNVPLALEQARRLIGSGRTAQAVPLLDEILAGESWNREAKRLRALTEMTSSPEAR